MPFAVRVFAQIIFYARIFAQLFFDFCAVRRWKGCVLSATEGNFRNVLILLQGHFRVSEHAVNCRAEKRQDKKNKYPGQLQFGISFFGNNVKKYRKPENKTEYLE